MTMFFANEVWVTPPGKETWPAGVIENTECIVEEGSYKDQLCSCDYYRNKDYDCHEIFLFILL